MRDEMREALDRIRTLEQGWDSYGAEPIDGHVVDRALMVYDALVAAGVEVVRVSPTTASTVVIYSRHEAVEVEKWEWGWDEPEPDPTP